jgi:hypothetical protein
MRHTLDKAIEIGRRRGVIIPLYVKKYIDDILAIIKTRPGYNGDPIEDFHQCLNAVHPRVQFTVEKEKDSTIPFLDCLLKRHISGQVITTVYRKPTETNIVIKKKSCHDPKVLIGAFKTALCRAHKICSTPELLKTEMQLLVDIWEDNGYRKEELVKFRDSYRPPDTLQDIQNAAENIILGPQWAQHINNNSSITGPVDGINNNNNDNNNEPEIRTINNRIKLYHGARDNSSGGNSNNNNNNNNKKSPIHHLPSVHPRDQLCLTSSDRQN